MTREDMDRLEALAMAAFRHQGVEQPPDVPMDISPSAIEQAMALLVETKYALHGLFSRSWLIAVLASLQDARHQLALAAVQPFVDIVFDGPPSHESGRFVEGETKDGRSIRCGQWLERPGTGYWVLRISVADIAGNAG